MTVPPVRLFPSSCRGALRRGLLAVAAAALVAGMAPPAALAQSGSVTGRVVHRETNRPVADVVVELISGSRQRVASATSDAEGRFEITGVPPGSYSLTVALVGHKPWRRDGIVVGAEPTQIGEVALESAPIGQPEMTVTASRTEQKALDAPASTSVVTREEIESRPATSSVDHVRDSPGVDVASNGLTQHNVVARGFNNVFSGSLYVLTDYRWASVPSLRFNAYNLIPSTDEDIERIEFVLGPASALYGPNVSNGVMHILTRSPLTDQGTTVSAMGGEQEVAQVSARHAGLIGERVGFKLSAQYFRGRDWLFRDPVEDGQRASRCRGCPPPATTTSITLADTFRIGARDFDAERFSGEGRMDFRFGERTDLVVSGGFSQMGSSIELTGVGAAQGHDWRSSYVQTRLSRGPLFVQGYVNFSNAGESYLLRDGARLRDNSLLYVGQVQRTASLGERQRFVYGADFVYTVPRTSGTINGRNEDDDKITEYGGYLQSETRVRDWLDLVAAVRLDDHSRMKETEFSPRAGLVYRPAEGHSLRATYNRAFNQPTSNNLFLDLVSARNLGGLPYDVRVTGVPEDGFQFARDVGGRPLMRSPFTPGGLGGPSQQLPLDVTIFWPVVQAAVPALAGVPAPTAAQVGSVMRSLNPTTRAFDTVADVADVDPLRSQINNTAEIGYKGFIANRLSLGVDLYFSRIEDFVSPLLVPTPNVFLDRASLAAYLVTQGFTAQQAAQIAAGVAGIDGNPAVTGIPLATVTPVSTVGDPFDIFLTYRNFGTVDLWGADLGATFLVNDQISFTGTYSIVDRNLFRNQEGIADIALNAPMNKATLSANYRNPSMGLSAALRGRYVDRFPVNSGVYVGVVDSYALMDANVSYALPFSRTTEVALAGTNVFDERHAEFIGAPELGRMVFLRLRQSF